MCTLAAFVRVTPDWPLLVAANRDEFLDRPALDPRPIAYDPWVVAGQDLSAGGTWFGVNQHGLVVGLLNRRQPAGPDPTRRSRGLLCLEVLQSRSPDDAMRRLRAVAVDAYNAFNLLVADAYEAFVATTDDRAVRITPLSPGVHLLTNLELNDPTCPRIAKSSQHFAALSLPRRGESLEPLLDALQGVLADHSTALDPRAHTIDTLCVHLPGYGTRSSSIVACQAGAPLRYWHAPGPPCRARFHEVPLPASDR